MAKLEWLGLIMVFVGEAMMYALPVGLLLARKGIVGPNARTLGQMFLCGLLYVAFGLAIDHIGHYRRLHPD